MKNNNTSSDFLDLSKNELEINTKYSSKSLNNYKNKIIKTYESSNDLYGICFQSNLDQIRIGLTSFILKNENYLEIIEYDKSTENFIKKADYPCELPCSCFLFSPSLSSKDLFITTSDNLSIYKLNEEDKKINLLSNLVKKKKVYCGSHTSADWSTANPSKVATCSIDSTSSIWDINELKEIICFICHKKEVYDISFGKDEFTFMTTGADGSIRLFDIRDSKKCEIVYGGEYELPKIKLSWNHYDPNYFLTTIQDKTSFYVFDLRYSYQPVIAILNKHENAINNAIWAPKTNNIIISVSDDKKSIIWDLFDEKNNDYLADYYIGNKEIVNVSWSDYSEDYIGMIEKNEVKMLIVNK